VYRQGHKVYRPTIHTVFGTAFHETVQNWLTVMYEVSGAEADKINLHEYLYDKLKFHYINELKNVDNTHFSTKEELADFLEDGIQILDFIRKNRSAYFSIKGWYLVGIEIPILITPEPEYPNTLYKGFLDLVLYNEKTDSFYIYDIKTSTRGWTDKEKKDEVKPMQLIYYKEYFSRQFGVPQDKINVEFFIVKRKLWEQSEFVQKRVQQWVPPSGPIKTKKALAAISDFITTCFNQDGTLKETQKEKKPSDTACRFCPFKDRADLCDRGS
jgi:alpha-L-arabinofuranosidase